MNRLVSSLLLCGFMVLPTTTASAQGRSVQQSCHYVGEQSVSHTQVECDDNVGYLVEDLIVSTYDTSTPLAITTPQASWLVFRPEPGTGSSVAVGWWDTQTQHLCALSEANEFASLTCGEVQWPGN
jgi:hypothetical protein